MLDRLKLNIVAFEGLTDDEFYNFCQDNPSLRIERNQNREIIIMSPTGSKSGLICAEILRQVANWNVESQLGFVFDSSTGFTLPDHSVFSADTTFVSRKQWESLSPELQERFAPLAPDFIIEVKSKYDSIQFLIEKMENWIRNGVLLGLLIDPEQQNTWVYRANGSIDIIEGFEGKVSGESVLPGFLLDLPRIKM